MDRSREDIRRPSGIVYTAQVGTKPGSLLLRHAGSLDHLRPFVNVAAQPRTKLLRCAPFGLRASCRAWYGVYGPKGLPRDIVNKLHGAFKKTLDEPNVHARIEEAASIAITPEEFAQQIKVEYDIYKKVVEERHIEPE